MKQVGTGDQHLRHFTFSADSTTASGSDPQLVIPEHTSRSSLFFQNTSDAIMWCGFGSARATCTIASGGVNAVTVTNGGFNFTRAPLVQFLGGGILPGAGAQIPANTSYVGAGGPGYPSPSRPAIAHAVLTGDNVTSIVIDDAGAGYITPPMVFLSNDPLDPNGCFDPSVGGGAGFQLYPSLSITLNGTVATTDPLAVFCASSSKSFSCWWTT